MQTPDFTKLRQHVTSNVLQSVLNRWIPELRAAEKETDATISIYEPIGYDYWTGEGMTAKRMAGILRNVGGKDVTVNINSPGGDVFEGLAIYNLLKEHPGKVTVKVIGLAASAASFIAMAGDEIQMAKASFMMIHNAWMVVAGDRNDLAEVSVWLTQFDETLASIYADRTGKKAADIAALMDVETWMNGEAAIDNGFADSILGDEVEKDSSKAAKNSLYKLDAALAQAGMPRAERKQLLKDLTMPGASESMPRAGSETGRDIFAELKINL